MEDGTFDSAVASILASDPRYKLDAYQFVREALERTQKAVNTRHTDGPLRHVSGQQLLEGIREHALAQFGPMATVVLEAWGISNSADFGEIVFNMIEARLLSKTERDCRADFCGLDFEDAFVLPFLPPSKLAVLRPELKPVPA
jgi:uncharacterized repeat protein (TIGR04138 family)